MSKIVYKIPQLSLVEKSVFTEATREELRVLLALIERGGVLDSLEELARICATSKARAISALTLWEEEGVIAKSELSTLTEEFEERILEGGIDEVDSREVARSIKEEGLAVMLEEIAEVMKKPALSTGEVKNVTALYTQYALSAEYIVTLAAHLASRGKLTAVRLKNEAIKLVGKECDTLEELEKYIEARNSENQADWEYRHILGIYGRTLSESEKKYFKKWSEEFGYGADIVSVAYDIAVINTGKGSLPYMNKLLSAWHDSGCTTVEECRHKSESERSVEKSERKPRSQGRKSEAEKPRYGSFDVNQAFQNALLRSYGEEEK